MNGGLNVRVIILWNYFNFDILSGYMVLIYLCIEYYILKGVVYFLIFMINLFIKN